jgi:hypothetical protein
MTGGRQRSELSDVLANGGSPVDAMLKPEVLALRATEDCIKKGKGEPVAMKFSALDATVPRHCLKPHRRNA